MNAMLNQGLDHSALRNRFRLEGELVTTSALHIGSGGSTDVQSASDMPIARNGAGHPYVPGSSLRGSLRSGLEALLRGIWGDDARGEDHGEPPDSVPAINVCDPLHSTTSCSARVATRRKEKSPFSEDEAFRLAIDRSCTICNLFGHSFLASRVWIADLPLVEPFPAADSYIRDGVGLDRDLRSASRGILYRFEAVPAGARFRLRLEVENADDAEVGLLLTGLDLFDTGFLALGGKRARGLGLAGVSRETLEVRRWEPADFFQDKPQGTVLKETQLTEFREAAHRCFGKGES